MNGKRKARALKNRLSPPQVLALGFGFLILVGTVLLNMPWSTLTGERIGYLNALFTATSATCVTGLTVVNTAHTFSNFGHVVILMLIQAGGLGFMTMSTLLALFLRKKISFKDRLVIKEQLNVYTDKGLVKFIIYVVRITLIIELLVAALLSISFIPKFGLGRGIWFSVFHSVSAFCNAGFDLLGNSLIDFQHDPLVNLAISGAIIIGGLGFVVYVDLLERKSFRRLHVQSKIVLLMTGVLLLVGALGFLVMEWANPGTLGTMTVGNKVMASFFQSVTARTAGFNTIELSYLRDSSAFLMIILMFIGASSGSTGGGLKLTTFSVILFTAISVIRGEEDVNIFARRIPDHIIRKSVAIAMACLGLVLFVTFALTLLEDFKFISLSYEVVSAFATVGVSQGITPLLKPISKLLIVLTMYIGRLGPLTMIYAFNTKVKPKNYRNAEGQISVG